MSDYNYNNGKFSNKDTLLSGDPDKAIKGSDFEVEFANIETAIASKLNSANPVFTGTMTGTSITISGELQAGLIDGGTY